MIASTSWASSTARLGAAAFVAAKSGYCERRHRSAPYRSADRAVYCATKHAVWAISEGLRQEHDDIRTTVISPGVTATELGHDISAPDVAAGLREWRKKSLAPDAIARAIRFALEQPDGVDVNEIIVRPTAADM